MKTFSYLWQYLAEFFLKMRNVLDEVVEKIKTHILCSITFLRKSCCLWDNVEKCGGARGATNDVTLWHIPVACWISKATRTRMDAPGHKHERAHAHRHKYVMVITFPRQKWLANASRCYFIRIFPVLLLLLSVYFHCVWCLEKYTGKTVRILTRNTFLFLRDHLEDQA
jgi:hypothetical protein